MGFGTLMKTGLKIFLVVIAARIIYFIATLIAAFLVKPLGVTAEVIALILFVPLAIFILGWLAHRFWEWE